MKIKIFYIAIIVSLNFYYSCSDNTLEQMPPQVAEYTQVDFEPEWNTDGDMVVYSHANIDNDLSGIYITGISGLVRTQIISNFARSPGWSPGGNKILYSQFFQIFKANTTGDSVVQLTNSGENYYPKWSSDGSLIAFSRFDGPVSKILIMNPDGQQLQVLDSNANYPGWESNSSSLLYFKPSFGAGGAHTGDTLYQYNLSNQTKNILTTLSGDVHKINMYPVYAGDEIIFCSMNKDGYVYIYKMSRNGSNIVKLTDTQGYSPAYSLINQKIIYTNRNKGNGRLWTMDKNGNNKIQLTY
ncbi:MAG: hypothetical protein ABI792_08845 [bacterium]